MLNKYAMLVFGSLIFTISLAQGFDSVNDEIVSKSNTKIPEYYLQLHERVYLGRYQYRWCNCYE